jgi:hypothetical protein
MNGFTRMSFWRHVSVGGAMSGLAEQWRANPYRWRTLAASIALTCSALYLFLPPNERIPPKPFDVVYISTFEDGRTEGQIIESNLANQKVQDGYRAIEQERIQLRKDLAEAIGRATGVDVDRMKADAAREEAREQRERDRLRDEIMARAAADKKARTEAVGD